MGMTDRTIPFPLRQRQVNFAVVPVGTPLAGRKEGSDRFQAASVPGRFVLELAQEFAPSGVADRFGQMMIRQQPLHIQALDIDRLVFVDQSTAQLVKKVRSLVGNFLMQSRHLYARFRAVSRSLLFSGELALRPDQLLFRLAQEMRSIDLFPPLRDREAFQPQVQPYLFASAFG